MACPAVAHRLPSNWTAPDTFDPLRFAPGREEGSGKTLSLIGFGGGRHKCPGMNFANTEIMMIAAMLVNQMDLELLTPDPGTDLGMGASRPRAARIRYRRKAAAAT
jgi:sterol 14alpha-demethylase